MAWEPDYCTVAELKGYLRIGDAVDDDELAAAISAASRAIDHATNRQFGVTAATEERTYDVEWLPRAGLYQAVVDDIHTTTGLVVTAAGSALAASAYQLIPRNASQRGRPWTKLRTRSATSATLGHGRPTVLVEATFGWSAVPDTIKQACLLQASRVFKRRDAPFGVAGSPDVGSEVRLLAKIDADVDVMVRPYRRDWPML